MTSGKKIDMPVSLSYSAGLSLDTAKKMLEAGEKEAKKRGVPVAIAATDAGGNLLAFSRMDDASLATIQIAIDKAFTAVFGKRPTGSWKSAFQTGELLPVFFHERWITFGGGFPIINNGTILGGIGVSGGTGGLDLYVARAALGVCGFTLEDVDAAIAEIEGRKK